MKYDIELFDLDVSAGETSIGADDVSAAVEAAKEWAASGDWDHPARYGFLIAHIPGRTTVEMVVSLGRKVVERLQIEVGS